MDSNNTSNDTTANSSDNKNLNHAIEIIKAAFPYLDSNSQESMDLIIKTGELMNTVNSLSHKDKVRTFSTEKPEIDIEGLLTNIRAVCYEKEREMVDMILNFIKAKNLYNTYATLSSVMASQSENSENSTGGGIFGGEGNLNMMELLESMLTPEQKSTFDNINMMFSVMQ